MYKNLEKAYVKNFELIDQKSATENKLYMLKQPHWQIYHKWIYNKHEDRLEPLVPPIIWEKVKELLPYKHVPAKLDMKFKSEYLETSNENRTQADGLKEDLIDDELQHQLIDATKLDEAINDLKKKAGHVPGKLDMKEPSLYISVENKDRVDLDVTDENQQHFLVDATKLDERLVDLPDTSYQHVPGRADFMPESKYIKVENLNRSQKDGLDEGINDDKRQHYVFDASELDKRIDELIEDKLRHAPSKLDKTDNEYDYISVKNENRTKDDGLPADVTDDSAQHHLVDTSKLDLFLSNLQINNGMEVQIAGGSTPGDNTSIDLGDISKFNDVKIYFRSKSFSVTRSVNFLQPKANEATSFVLTNIGDTPNPPSEITGEIGQTLAQLNKDMSKASLRFFNSMIWRFRNDQGTGGNGEFNVIDEKGPHMLPGGSIKFGKVTLPYPSIGDGWVEILKISAVIYGSASIDQTLQAIIDRLNSNDFVTYNDYRQFLKMVLGCNHAKKQALLKHVDKFKNELNRDVYLNKLVQVYKK